MIREWLTVTLLAGLIGTVANAAPNSTPSDSLGIVLKQRAQLVFGLSDKDHDQGLNRDEQANAEKRMQTAFSLLSQANTLAGPRVPVTVAEPTPGNPDFLTAQEFIQLFQARAAKYDAHLRAKRYARSHPPALPKMVPTAVASSNKSSWQSNDWSDKKDRSDKDDQKSSHFSQQSNFQSQTNWPMMTQSHGYYPHVVHHSSHQGGYGGSYGYGGSFGGGGGGFMSGGGGSERSEKHEGKHEGGRHHHK